MLPVRSTLLISALLPSLILIGCAAPQTRAPSISNATTDAETKKQQELVVEDYMSNYKKLQNVSSRIITNGTDLCGDKTSSYYGFNRLDSPVAL